MVEQRGNLDYGRDDETPPDTPTVEGDGFTMTDTNIDAAIERPETEQPPEKGEHESDDAQKP